MQKLIRFLVQYNFIILFIIIEIFSISLIVRYNPYQREIFSSGIQELSAYVYDKYNSVTSYFNLKNENIQLRKENSLLTSERIYGNRTIDSDSIIISNPINDYEIIASNVINLTYNKRNNYLILDKGSKDGVKRDMAVLGPEGIVGVIIGVSNNYSSAISVLNAKTGISAKIKKNAYFGIMTWNGLNYRRCVLKEIPDFVDLNIGDTIVTSSYSAIFPEGQLIGFVNNTNKIEGSGFQEVEILLSTDFKKLSYAYIIKNNNRNELIDLKKNTINDQLDN